MKTIAVVGEIITADARLRAYEQGPRKPTTHEELGIFLETYDVLLQRTIVIVADFLNNQNWEVLAKELPEIRDSLVRLY